MIHFRVRRAPSKLHDSVNSTDVYIETSSFSRPLSICEVKIKLSFLRMRNDSRV